MLLRYFFILCILVSCKVRSTKGKNDIRAVISSLKKPLIYYQKSGNPFAGGDEAIDEIFCDQGKLYIIIKGIKISNLQNKNNLTSKNICLLSGSFNNNQIGKVEITPQDVITRSNLYISSNLKEPFICEAKHNPDGSYNGAIPGFYYDTDEEGEDRYIFIYDMNKNVLNLSSKTNQKYFLSMFYNSGKRSNIIGGQNLHEKSSVNLMNPVTILPELVEECSKKTSSDIGSLRAFVTSENEGLNSDLTIRIELHISDDIIYKMNNDQDIKMFIYGNKLPSDIEYMEKKKETDKHSPFKNLIKKESILEDIKIFKNNIRSAIKNAYSIKELEGFKIKENSIPKNHFDLFFNEKKMIIPLHVRKFKKSPSGTYIIEFKIKKSAVNADLKGEYLLQLCTVASYEIKKLKDKKIDITNLSREGDIIKFEERFLSVSINKEGVNPKFENNKYILDNISGSRPFTANLFLKYSKAPDAAAANKDRYINTFDLQYNFNKPVNINYEGIGEQEMARLFILLIRENKAKTYFEEKNDALLNKAKTLITDEKIISKETNASFNGKNIDFVKIDQDEIISFSKVKPLSEIIKMFNENKFGFSFSQKEGQTIAHHNLGQEAGLGNNYNDYYCIPAILCYNDSEGKEVESAKLYWTDYSTALDYEKVLESAVGNNVENKTLSSNFKSFITKIFDKGIYLSKSLFGNITGASDKKNDIKVLAKGYKRPQKDGVENIKAYEMNYKVEDTNLKSDPVIKNIRNYFGVNLTKNDRNTIKKYIENMAGHPQGTSGIDNLNPYLQGYDASNDMPIPVHAGSPRYGIALMKDSIKNKGVFEAKMMFDCEKRVNNISSSSKAEDVVQDPGALSLNKPEKKGQEKSLWLKNSLIEGYENKERKTPLYLSSNSILKIALSGAPPSSVNSNNNERSSITPNSYSVITYDIEDNFQFRLPSKGTEKEIFFFPQEEKESIVSVQLKPMDYILSTGNRKLGTKKIEDIFSYFPDSIISHLKNNNLSIKDIKDIKAGNVNNIIDTNLLSTTGTEFTSLENLNPEKNSTIAVNPLRDISVDSILNLDKYITGFDESFRKDEKNESQQDYATKIQNAITEAKKSKASKSMNQNINDIFDKDNFIIYNEGHLAHFMLKVTNENKNKVIPQSKGYLFPKVIIVSKKLYDEILKEKGKSDEELNNPNYKFKDIKGLIKSIQQGNKPIDTISDQTNITKLRGAKIISLVKDLK